MGSPFVGVRRERTVLYFFIFILELNTMNIEDMNINGLFAEINRSSEEATGYAQLKAWEDYSSQAELNADLEEACKNCGGFLEAAARLKKPIWWQEPLGGGEFLGTLLEAELSGLDLERMA